MPKPTHLRWSDYPGPYVQFANVSTDDGKYIMKMCQANLGNDAFFAVIKPFEGPGTGQLFNFCWQQGGSGQGANTQPAANPPNFDVSKYTPSTAVAAAVAGWNTWFKANF